MINVFMIIICAVICILVILASIYLIAYFQHPDDKNVAWLPKIIVIIGLTLAAISILMLPLDVANKGGAGGFPMDTMWLVVYIIIACFAVVIVPFAMFYYESEEADPGLGGNQFTAAIKGTFAILFVFVVLTVLLYVFVGIAQIPTMVVSGWFTVTDYGTTDSDTKTVIDSTIIPAAGNTTTEYRQGTQFLQYRVSIALFIITMVSFLGWLLFIIFGGIGLSALPFDMISDFKNRPRRISYDKYIEKKAKIGERSTELLSIGKELQSKMPGGVMNRRDRKNYNRYRQAVFLLEEDHNRLQQSYKIQGGKIILYYAQFFGGFIALGLSLGWLLHIIIYMITQPEPFNGFLNNLVIALDKAWGFLGVIVYGLLSFYLALCVIKGNFKFGLRVFFLFPIHPMRVGETMMNAFLFNVGLILVCCVSITQFCTMAFSQYTSLTQINSMFETSIKNLKVLKWFWVVYIFAIFIMAILTALFLFIKPKDKPAKIKL